ncbi:MAG: hypothetical protein R3E54_04725 [Halioglobus sp.]
MLKHWIYRIARCVSLAALVCLSTLALAADDLMESDWIQLVKGHKDVTTGVEVMEIDDEESPVTRKITLAVPKSAVGERTVMEEVVVIGRRPDAPEPIEMTYEWVKDYDNDRYGLVIRLGKNSNWPIRLYMNSAAGFVE